VSKNSISGARARRYQSPRHRDVVGMVRVTTASPSPFAMSAAVIQAIHRASSGIDNPEGWTPLSHLRRQATGLSLQLRNSAVAGSCLDFH